MKYVGARYMPKFVGTYDITTDYEALSVVDNGLGTSYVANKPVPAGTPLTDTNYWAIYGAVTGAILNLQQQINDMNNGAVPGSLQNQIVDIKDNQIYFNVCFPPTDYTGNALDNSGANDVTSDLQDIINYISSKGGGTVFFPAGLYLISGQLSITSGKIRFLGCSYGSVVLFKDTDTTMFSISSNFIEFENIIFRNTLNNPTALNVALSLDTTKRNSVKNCGFYNFNTAIHMDKAAGTRIVNCSITIDHDITHTDTIYAILMVGNCASSRILHTAFSVEYDITVDSYGIYNVTHVQDIFIDDFETAGCGHSIHLENANSINSGDVQIRNCTFDLIKNKAIYLHNIKNPTYRNTSYISDIYITPYADMNEMLYLYDCASFAISNVIANNPQKLTGSTDTVLRLYNCENISIDNCVFTGIARGMRLNDSANLAITGCNVSKCDSIGTTGITAGGIHNTVISSCVFDVSTTAVTIDVNSTKCITSLLVANGASISNPSTGGVSVNNV